MFQGCVAGLACRNEWIRMDSRQNSQADDSNCTSNWTPESERMKRKEKDSSDKRRTGSRKASSTVLQVLDCHGLSCCLGGSWRNGR
jgi:hypothetical protein